MQRRLTVILSADIVGYSALMERDEAGTHARLKENRLSVFDPHVADHGGRVFKLMGDGALVEFPSAVAAVSCAVAIQKAMELAEQRHAESQRLRYRIGINIGDVIIDGDDIYGDGVNVAARIQSLAPVGGVAVTRTVSDHVAGKVGIAFENHGEVTVKNIERPVHVFTVRELGSGRISASSAPKEEAARISVCVLPFANMSGESEQEHFADGISEDIITDLSRVSALSVISRNSAFMYKGQHVDLPRVARELKVTHVLEGSVRKSGNRVRITAQLIHGATNDHVWAERFDRDLSDIFAVQDEISEAIVKALRLRLLPEEKKQLGRRGTENVEAYSLVVEARHYLRAGRSSERFLRAVVRMCERAIELDPGFAEAWSTVGRARERLRFETGISTIDGSKEIARALELDPENHLVLSAHALILQRAGRTAEADVAITRALAIDGQEPDVVLARASMFFRQKHFDLACEWYERAAHLNRHGLNALGMMLTCARSIGDRDAARRAATMAIERCEAILRDHPDHTDAMGWMVPALVELGQTERVQYWIRRALMFDPDNFSAVYNFACALTAIGEFEQALELLEKMSGAFSADSLQWARNDPDLDPIRHLPRFQAFIENIARRLA